MQEIFKGNCSWPRAHFHGHWAFADLKSGLSKHGGSLFSLSQRKQQQQQQQ
jgi:lambda repressor-like predicted transcriptional regulator